MKISDKKNFVFFSCFVRLTFVLPMVVMVIGNLNCEWWWCVLLLFVGFWFIRTSWWSASLEEVDSSGLTSNFILALFELTFFLISTEFCINFDKNIYTTPNKTWITVFCTNFIAIIVYFAIKNGKIMALKRKFSIKKIFN